MTGGYTSRKTICLPVVERNLVMERPECIRNGKDLTIVGSGHATSLALDAALELEKKGISAEVIDLRVLNPFHPEEIIKSVTRTGRLLSVDGGWGPCGVAAEVIASVSEFVSPHLIKSPPVRVTIPFAPAPTASNLESVYYPTVGLVVQKAEMLCE